jgi:hypothetical protein
MEANGARAEFRPSGRVGSRSGGTARAEMSSAFSRNAFLSLASSDFMIAPCVSECCRSWICMLRNAEMIVSLLRWLKMSDSIEVTSASSLRPPDGL